MTKKYNIIGDIHGMTNWKKFVKDDAVNVFLGDYFDPYTNISFEKLKESFESIIEFKKNHPETVLLLGNHDTHYIYKRKESSRYIYSNCDDIYQLFMDNINCFTGVAFAPNSHYLCSHAGFSKSWINTLSSRYKVDIPETIDDAKVLANWANNLFALSITNDKNNAKYSNAKYSNAKCSNAKYSNAKYKEMFMFSKYADTNDYYGTSKCHSCIWIRPVGLLFDSVSDKIVQIVGHTEVGKPLKEINENGNRIVFTDCLRTKKANSYLLSIDE